MVTLILFMIFFIQSSQRIYAQESLSAETPFIEVNGKIVKEFINTNMQPGNYKVVWDGTNKGGVLVGSGIYFYRIKAGSFIASQKMILLK